MEADDKSVLDHILDCDVERKSLLEEMDKLTKTNDADLDAEEKAELAKRLSYVATRLDAIDSTKAESKAVKIL